MDNNTNIFEHQEKRFDRIDALLQEMQELIKRTNECFPDKAN